MTYVWDFSIIFEYKLVFFKGLISTLNLTIFSIFIGSFIGLIVAMLLYSKYNFISFISKLFIEFFRAIPALILLIWLYYAIPILINIKLSSMVTAIVAFSLSLSAFIAETVRSAFESIPINQIDAAKVIGMNNFQIIIRIIFPQVIRQMLPNLMNQYITLFKFSSIASIVSVNELLHVGTQIIAVTYRPIEVYTVVAFIYTFFVILFNCIIKKIEYKLLFNVAKSNDNIKKIAWWKG